MKKHWYTVVLRTRVLPLVVLGVLGTLLVGIGLRAAPTAHAAPPVRGASIEILPNVHLATVNGVAGVTVRLKYSCPPSPDPNIGTMGTLLVNALQMRSEGTASGFIIGFDFAVCNGRLHVITVFVPTARFAVPFAPGEVIVTAEINIQGSAIAEARDVPLKIPGRPTS